MGLHVKLFLILALGALACAMSTEAWRAYKESDAYKQERALIEARKERARSFQSDAAKDAGQSSGKAPAYSYIHTLPPLASLRFGFEINGVKAAIPYESSHPLDQYNKNIERLVVAVHSSNHDAVMYLQNTSALARETGKDGATLIVAPQMLIPSLMVQGADPDYLYWEVYPFWGSSKARYRGRKADVSAFEVFDSLIGSIIGSQNFPNLRSVVIFGHSAGGQFVNRYAACSRFERNGVAVKYVVMAPSSYLYFNKERAVRGTVDRFAVPDVASERYNRWGAGTEHLYSVHRRYATTPHSMQAQYANSNITYFVGAQDNDPDNASLSKTEASMWQGRERLERAQIYHNYLKHYFGERVTAHHLLFVIPGAGHSSKALMNSKEGRTALFL